MKVKRFFAPDMRQAMARVREEIGPDAVIVSNRRVAGGVEVVAAHEQDYEAAQAEFERERALKRRRDEQIRVLTGNASETRASGVQGVQRRADLSAELAKARARVKAAEQDANQPASLSPKDNANVNRQIADESLDSILAPIKKQQQAHAQEAFESYRRQSAAENIAPTQENSTAQQGGVPNTQNGLSHSEIDKLKALLNNDAQPVQEARPSASLGRFQARFDAMGISGRLQEQLASGIENNLPAGKEWQHMLSRLGEAIPVAGQDFMERGGMVAFVGPTGVGKTTSIGKLAAKYVLQHGSSSIALVTTDTYRIAAHEQLKTFGRILDVPVKVVDGTHSLDSVLHSLRNKRLVLVDTAGLSEQDAHSQEQRNMLLDVSLRMKTLLVVSCSSQRQVMEKGYNAYHNLGLSGCVLSKLDEAGSIGEALSFAIEKQLPITYAADGQKIPDDISVAQKKDLVSRAVFKADEVRSSLDTNSGGRLRDSYLG
ncbi:MAG: flagellar biosynthesis protein FlhF [Pontibacterium sp.]